MSTTASLAFGTLAAPAHWQCVDVLSDVHLQAQEPATFEVWRNHMASTPADAVLLLGDVFEVWVGDDAVAHDAFLQSCAQVLREAAQTRYVAFMPGNRDFLLGQAFLDDCGLHPLQDPTVLVWGAQRILLSHGDALCLDDVDYQRFRATARTHEWQHRFLSQSLPQRLRLAQEMRQASQAHNQSMQSFADADVALVQHWLQETNSPHLIHGHTHRPADHAVPGLPAARRQVLSDWHVQAGQSPRAQVLRLYAGGGHARVNIQAGR